MKTYKPTRQRLKQARKRFDKSVRGAPKERIKELIKIYEEMDSIRKRINRIFLSEGKQNRQEGPH